MKYKLIQIISIIGICAFARQPFDFAKGKGLAWGRPGQRPLAEGDGEPRAALESILSSEGSGILRPRAYGEKPVEFFWLVEPTAEQREAFEQTLTSEDIQEQLRRITGRIYVYYGKEIDAPAVKFMNIPSREEFEVFTGARVPEDATLVLAFPLNFTKKSFIERKKKVRHEFYHCIHPSPVEEELKRVEILYKVGSIKDELCLKWCVAYVDLCPDIRLMRDMLRGADEKYALEEAKSNIEECRSFVSRHPAQRGDAESRFKWTVRLGFYYSLGVLPFKLEGRKFAAKARLLEQNFLAAFSPYASQGELAFAISFAKRMVRGMHRDKMYPAFKNMKEAIVMLRAVTTRGPQGLGVTEAQRREADRSILRPLARADRGLAPSDSDLPPYIKLGAPITDLNEVPCLKEAMRILRITDPRLQGTIESCHFRRASGLAMTMQPRIVDGAYEVLVDETLVGNDRLQTEIAQNGWNGPFTEHLALCLDMTLRHAALLLEENRINGMPEIAVEAAKVMVGREWMKRRNGNGTKDQFLGTRRKNGLVQLLDDACPNGHPSRFKKFYRMMFLSDTYPLSADSGERITAAERTVRRIDLLLRGIEPALQGECLRTDVILLLMELNPIDGRQLARDICDKAARECPKYTAGEMDSILPDSKIAYPEGFRLTYMQELALMKAYKDDPLNNDVNNAFVHCNALTVNKATQWIIRRGLHKRAKIETEDVRQIALTILAYNLRTFHPGKGTRFNTVLTECLNRWMTGSILVIADNIESYQFGDNEDGISSAADAEQYREFLPIESVLVSAAREDVKMMLSCVPPRERLFIKLLYGIRFEGGPAERWSQERIGKLCGISHVAVGQIVRRALTQLNGIERFTIGMPYLDDGDIYLAVEIGLLPDSKFFDQYCMKGSAWLRENAPAIRAMLSGAPSPQQTTKAAAWLSFDDELKHSTERQRHMAKLSARSRALGQNELKKYKEFKRLVAEYLYGDYTAAERKELLSAIVDGGSLRAPVKTITVRIKTKKSKANPEGKYTRRELSLSELRGGREWKARSVGFGDVVHIIPTIVGGRLNIEVRNSMSSGAMPLYNSYWDTDKDDSGGAVDVSLEYAEFFMDDTSGLPVPSRPLARRPQLSWVDSGHAGEVTLFEHKGKVGKLFTDARYASISPSEMKAPARIYWFSAFRDKKDKGVVARLNPGGVVVGRAHYRNGEFVPEPGPLLRSAKHSVLTADRTANFIDRLRALAEDKDSVVIVERRSRKRPKGYKVSPFGTIGETINYVKVSDKPRKEPYHVRFLPHDNRFDIYPGRECAPAQRINGKFYDLDTLRIFDAREELRKRFDRFAGGAVPNSILIKAGGTASARIYLTKDKWINMGRENRGKNYFIVFAKGGADTDGIIYIYETAGERGGWIKPVRLVKTVYLIKAKIIGGIKKPVILDDPSFEPYKLVGEGRVLVQAMAHQLGYMGQPRPITPGEEMEKAGRAGSTAASSVLRPLARADKITHGIEKTKFYKNYVIRGTGRGGLRVRRSRVGNAELVLVTPTRNKYLFEAVDDIFAARQANAPWDFPASAFLKYSGRLPDEDITRSLIEAIKAVGDPVREYLFIITMSQRTGKFKVYVTPSPHRASAYDTKDLDRAVIYMLREQEELVIDCGHVHPVRTIGTFDGAAGLEYYTIFPEDLLRSISRKAKYNISSHILILTAGERGKPYYTWGEIELGKHLTASLAARLVNLNLKRGLIRGLYSQPVPEEFIRYANTHKKASAELYAEASRQQKLARTNNLNDADPLLLICYMFDLEVKDALAIALRMDDERGKSGRFRSWEDLRQRVAGIGPKTIQKLRKAGYRLSTEGTEMGIRAGQDRLVASSVLRPRAAREREGLIEAIGDFKRTRQIWTGEASLEERISYFRGLRDRCERALRGEGAAGLPTYGYISDIHGDWDAWERCMLEMEQKGVDVIVVDGDIIDRGPDGPKIIEDIMRRFSTGQRIVYILGSHEGFFIRSMEGNIPTFTRWMAEGGAATLKGAHVPVSTADSIAEYCKQAVEDDSKYGDTLARRKKGGFVDPEELQDLLAKGRANAEMIAKFMKEIVINNSMLKKIHQWLKENTVLYFTDAYDNLSFHNKTPVDEEGMPALSLMGVKGFAALDRAEKAVS
ncbi:MAG: metallophosphoesterase, partial [Candidatus Omnitrophica bacterium]|nr:metallophosphoesterase [Candidatus Omnitrophota bacterium]